MNQSLKDLYEEYRDEMVRTLSQEETAPERFVNADFVEYFESKVERLDTLIWLYADLIAARRS